MRILKVLILLMLYGPASAQGFRAYCETSGNINSVNRDIIETSPGNYMGWAVGVSVENSLAYYRINVFGLDGNGQQKWMKKYGTANWCYFSYHFTNRSFYKRNNHVYIATTLLDSLNNYSAILLKFDFQGNLLWQKVIQDTSQQLFPMRVVSSTDGGFLITGMAQKGSHEHVFCLKTDSLGNKVWLKNYLLDIKRSQARCLLQDSTTGKIIFTGVLSYSGASWSDTKSMVMVTDSAGNFIEMKHHYSGLNVDMIQSGKGKYLLTGMTIWYAQFRTSKPHALLYDINNISTPIWQYEYGTEQLEHGFTSIDKWDDSTFIVSGFIDTTWLKTSGYANTNLKYSFLNSQGRIKKELIYNYRQDTTVDFARTPRTVLKTSDGGWIVPVSNSFNDTMAYYFKYDANGCDSTLNYCLTVGLKEQVKMGISVFPNPSSDRLFITKSGAFNIPNTIEIVDLTGRIVGHYIMDANGLTLDIISWVPGMYLIRFKHKDQTILTEKFFKTN